MVFKKAGEVRYRIVDSIRKIDRNDWDFLFGDIPEGYDFYQVLEESNLKEFSFYYLILYRGRDILSIAPLFVADFHVDIVLEGFVKKVFRFIRHFVPRFFILRTLFCGSPFGESGSLGITKDFKEIQILMDKLLRAMEGFCKESKIPFIIFKDFLENDLLLLKPLERKSFLKVDSFPSVRIELNFESLEKYFERLSNGTRKDLRRKIRKAYSRANIEIRVVDGVEDIIDDVYKLYLNTYRASDVRFEFLTKDFFINVSKRMKPHTKYFLYYVDGKLSAFNLCFVYKDRLIDKFIGFNYDIARRYSLYFVSWCFNIEWCLKNSIRFYQVGQTDYEPKMRLGGSLVPLYAYFKHRNFILNVLIRLLATWLLESNSPIRNAEI